MNTLLIGLGNNIVIIVFYTLLYTNSDIRLYSLILFMAIFTGMTLSAVAHVIDRNEEDIRYLRKTFDREPTTRIIELLFFMAYIATLIYMGYIFSGVLLLGMLVIIIFCVMTSNNDYRSIQQSNDPG